MLDPDGPARKPDAAERRRRKVELARKARNQRAWRERNRPRKKPAAVYGVTVSFATLETLIGWNWFSESESADKRKVGRAISEQLADAASRKNFP